MTNTTTISCPLATGGAATIDGTGACTQANFQANSCHGCIDTSKIFITWYSGLAQGQWKTQLDSKFGGSGCTSTFNTYFGNVWDNYYQTKTANMVAISNRWNAVADATNPASSISVVTTDMNNINTTMAGVITTLKSSVEVIIDPKYGLIAGLNCQIIGEDLQLVIGSICISNFNTLYITRLLMGIAAFGILFAMCCIVCSGVRHFKHS